jgi:hypothetical protein
MEVLLDEDCINLGPLQQCDEVMGRDPGAARSALVCCDC